MKDEIGEVFRLAGYVVIVAGVIAAYYARSHLPTGR